MNPDHLMRLSPERGRGRRAEGSAGEGARGEDGPLTLTLSRFSGRGQTAAVTHALEIFRARCEAQT